MRAPHWLIERPIAHRGLHAADKGIIENTPSSVRAAIAGGFGIEVDLQLSADFEAMVYHDDALGRLTEGNAPLRSLRAEELKRVPFRATSDCMFTLGELCDLVAGRVPLILEMKSQFDNDVNLVRRIADVLKTYSGPVAAMSFDPHQVALLRELAPTLTRGIVAQSHYDDAEWSIAQPEARARMRHLRHAFATRPHFIAYWVRDLPAPAPWIARHIFGCPILTWTVRTQAQRDHARRHADQMIFEGFVP
jgi:glycerophosphoryl diester phosphodiesterase